LGFGKGLAAGTEELRFFIVYVTVCKADIVVGEGLSRVEAIFYYSFTSYLLFFRLGTILVAGFSGARAGPLFFILMKLY